MASKKAIQCQLMYPKKLVYPSEGEETQLEMIRARWPCYQITEDETDNDDGSCDMEMTEAFPGNITLNVPVLSSVQNGKLINLLHQKNMATGKPTSSKPFGLPTVSESDIDNELAELCVNEAKDEGYTSNRQQQKESSNQKGVDVDRQLEQLSLDSDLENKHYDSQNTTGIGSSLGSKPGTIGFTPSINDDSSLASSLMATRLNFSEADSARNNVSLQRKQLCSNAELSSNHSVVPESFSVFEEPSMSTSTSFVGQKSAKLEKPRLKRPLEEVLQDEPSRSILPESFSVFEEQSMSTSSLVGQKAAKPGPNALRKPLEDLSRGKPSQSVLPESFSVFEEQSMSTLSFVGQKAAKPGPNAARKPLGNLPQDESSQSVLPESFSVFEEQSMSTSSFVGQKAAKPRQNTVRKPLGDLPQDEPSQSVLPESFSIFEEQSMSTSSFMGQKAAKPKSNASRKPLGNLSQDEPSQSVLPESFSIFEEQSMSTSSFMGQKAVKPRPIASRKPLGNLSQDEPSQSVLPESFSVFEEPSLSTSSFKNNKLKAFQNEIEFDSRKRVDTSTEAYHSKDPNQLSNSSNSTTSENQCAAKPSQSQPPPPAVSTNKEETVEDFGFTEFDIPSCNTYEPTSTPSGKRMGLNLSVDLTMIHSDVNPITKLHPPFPVAAPQHNPLPMPLPSSSTLPPTTTEPPIESFTEPHPPTPAPPRYLYVIQEESRSNYTSSTSGSSNNTSKLTNWSRSSLMSNPGQCNEDDVQLELKEAGVMSDSGQVKAFANQTIDFMLQSIPIAHTPLTKVSAPLPRLTCASSMVIEGFNFTIEKKIATGGFASVFLAANSKNPLKDKKVFKVQKPSWIWECTMVEELHKRLKANDLCHKSPSFMKIDSLHVYNDGSIIVMDYYPHGTLLDAVNRASSRVPKTKFSELLIAYYALELLDIVETLHSCGIIHADIKPDNIMLRDMKPFSNLADGRGKGVCLIDFGRALDVQAFPRGAQFIGSNKTDGFQCPQMINNTPWTYQADLYCVAGCIHVMMFNSYMDTVRDSSTGLLKITNSIMRSFDRVLWTDLYSSLLNWQQPSTDVSQRPDMPLITKSLVKRLQEENLNLLYRSYQYAIV